MIKYYKPARDKNYQRGFFSYITESVINLYNAEKTNFDNIIKIYHDLFEIPGYGSSNLFDICFEQDKEDFFNNQHEYLNIENVIPHISVDLYDMNNLENTFKKDCELIIKKYFVYNSEFSKLILSRHDEIDFTKTIGFHRRTTDISRIHNITIIPIENMFLEIEKEDFEYIFLMSDNFYDLQKFKNRYGKRLITFDNNSTSKNTHNPFFKNGITDEDIIKDHIQEIVFGALTLGKVKKLICTKSNLTGFSILSNSKLDYKIVY